MEPPTICFRRALLLVAAVGVALSGALPTQALAVTTPGLTRFFGPSFQNAPFCTFQQQNVSINGSVLTVSYPPGSSAPSAGAPYGGAQVCLPFSQGTASDATLTYDVRFPVGFQFVKGGKLPGMYGGVEPFSGGAHNGNGWSMRLMWRTGGAAEVYGYISSTVGYGDEWGTGNFNFAADGRFHRLTEHIHLNSAGRADGWVTLAYDGQQYIAQTGLAITTTGTPIAGLFFSTFYGGHDATWAPTAPMTLDFANFNASPGAAPTTGSSAPISPAPAPAPAPAGSLAAAGGDRAAWTHGSRSWATLGGALAGAPALIRLPEGGDLLVATGVDNQLWVRTTNSAWARLSSQFTRCFDNPAASLAPGTRTLTVVCLGGDHAVWTASGPVPVGGLPTLNGWHSLGGRVVSGPALAYVLGQVEVLVNGADGQVWRGGPGRPWQPTGWRCVGHPALAVAGETAYFGCHGTDGALWAATRLGSGPWSPTRSAGGALVDGVGIAALSGDTAQYAVEGTDHRVWYTAVAADATATGFGALGGVVDRGMAAAA